MQVTRLEQLSGSRWRIHASQGESAAPGSLYDGAAGVEVFEDVDAVVLADVMTILPGMPLHAHIILIIRCLGLNELVPPWPDATATFLVGLPF